jgi:enamine deaminase RidA (YjgF/YER057c/UK114 family)
MIMLMLLKPIREVYRTYIFNVLISRFKITTSATYHNNNDDYNRDRIEAKLNSIGLKIPQPLKVPPNVKTPSVWIRLRGDKAYISGHGPQNPDGSVAGPFGKVGTNDMTVEQGYESAKLACLSILGSLKRELGRLDKVVAWLQVRVMINTVEGFTKTADVADGFSDLVLTLYGQEVGMHARSAIGVQALPLNLPVIVDALVEITT